MNYIAHCFFILLGNILAVTVIKSTHSLPNLKEMELWTRDIVEEARIILENENAPEFGKFEKELLEDADKLRDTTEIGKWIIKMANGILCSEKFKNGQIFQANKFKIFHQKFCANLSHGIPDEKSIFGLKNDAANLMSELFSSKTNKLTRGNNDVKGVENEREKFMRKVDWAFEQFVFKIVSRQSQIKRQLMEHGTIRPINILMGDNNALHLQQRMVQVARRRRRRGNESAYNSRKMVYEMLQQMCEIQTFREMTALQAGHCAFMLMHAIKTKPFFSPWEETHDEWSHQQHTIIDTVIDELEGGETVSERGVRRNPKPPFNLWPPMRARQQIRSEHIPWDIKYGSCAITVTAAASAFWVAYDASSSLFYAVYFGAIAIGLAYFAYLLC